MPNWLRKITLVRILLVLAVLGTVASMISSFMLGSKRAAATPVVGEVLSVRLNASATEEVRGHPALGAVVGSLIAGTVGAGIGAAVESTSEPTVAVNVTNCRIVVRIGSQRFSFDAVGDGIQRCSLTRGGDKIEVIKVFEQYEVRSFRAEPGQPS